MAKPDIIIVGLQMNPTELSEGTRVAEVWRAQGVGEEVAGSDCSIAAVGQD